MSHADEVPDVDVAREDQMRINLFGRLNNKKHFIEDTIKDIKVPDKYTPPHALVPAMGAGVVP